MITIMDRGIALPVEELDLPSVLYKFRDYTDAYHTSSLLKSHIYIPSAKEFNDPHDCNLPFRYREEDLTRENLILKANEMIENQYANAPTEEKQRRIYEAVESNRFRDPDYLADFDKDSYEKLNRDFGIFCLTPNIGNFLMWSYYAYSHRGFAIGYDPKELLKSGLFKMGGMIHYTNEFPTFPLLSRDYVPGNYFANIFFKKSEIWWHEDEYRLLHLLGKGKVHSLPKQAFSEIVFGVNFDDGEQVKFTEKILKIYPHIRVSKMELLRDTFGLRKVLQIDPNL